MLLKKCAAALAVMLFVGSLLSVNAQNSEFTYQGSLKDGPNAANGSYDFEFLLFDAVAGGAQQGPTLTRNGVTVSNGNFGVTLDFGNQFPGAGRFLEIRVRPTGGGAFTPLLPRQPVNSSPYAVKSVNADNATNATTAANATNATTATNATNATNATTAVSFSGSLLGDVTGTQNATAIGTGAVTTAKLADNSVTNAKIVDVAGSKITGLITTATIPGANVTGVVANATNASTAATATNALQLGGVAANQYVVTTDLRMTDARTPTAGSASYIQNQNAGAQASSNFNISGNGTAGGTLTGNVVNTETQFSVLGVRVLSAPIFTDNTFVGRSNGPSTSGLFNSFFGSGAGFNNTSGSRNTFLGWSAGAGNTTGSNNATVGFNAIMGSNNLSYAGAFGADAVVSQSDSLVLGRPGTRVGIGISNPVTSLHVVAGAAKTTVATTRALLVSTNDPYTSPGNPATPFALDIRLIGAANLADRAAFLQTTDVDTADGGNILLQPQGGRVGIGTTAPGARLHVSGGSILLDNSQGVFLKDTVGASKRALFADEINILRIGSGGAAGFSEIRLDVNSAGEVMTIKDNGNVGIGTTAPDQRLSVNGNASKVGGGSWAVFSDERLKNVNGRYTRGLVDLMRLNPIRFEYKPDNALGLRGEGEYVGFSAQEVERVLPEAVTRSANGYLQINNDPIIWTTLNAVKEQQAQIGRQQEQIEKQQQQLQRQQEQMHKQQRLIDGLKKLVCQNNSQAEVCRDEQK